MINKIIIKQFKDGSSNFFVDCVHYKLEKDGSIVFCAGGLDTEERKEALSSFIKRNKKIYKERPKVIIKEYTEKFKFGKHINKTVEQVYYEEKSYLKFILSKITDINLKNDIIEILK